MNGFDERQRRKHDRLPLVAAVECKIGDEIRVLMVRNASLAGLFLEGSPREHPDLVVGSVVDIALSAEDDPEGEPIQLQARIVRVEKRGPPFVPGFGLAIVSVSAKHHLRFRDLLSRQKL